MRIIIYQLLTPEIRDLEEASKVFEPSTKPGVWPHIAKKELLHDIRQTTANPYKVDQGQTTPLCGPEAVVFELVSRHPAQYVVICQALYETGEFEGRTKTVSPSSTLINSRALRTGLLAAKAIDRALSGDGNAITEFAADRVWEFGDYLSTRSYFYQQETRWPEQAFWRRRHGAEVARDPIALDPLTRIQANRRLQGDLAGVQEDPAPSDLRQLREICPFPRPAHEIARALGDSVKRPLSEERSIQILQHSLAHGIVEVVA